MGTQPKPSALVGPGKIQRILAGFAFIWRGLSAKIPAEFWRDYVPFLGIIVPKIASDFGASKKET